MEGGKERNTAKTELSDIGKGAGSSGIGLPIFMPIRPGMSGSLEFDKHIFVKNGPGAVSSLELDAGEVKNENPVTFDIPPHLVKMLTEYRERDRPGTYRTSSQADLC